MIEVMETHPYWQRQTHGQPLFPHVEWNKPEQRSQAGRLGIVGGNKLGFAGVGEAYGIALKAGVGEVRVLLPDVLRKTIPPSITDAIFATTNPSGSLNREALPDMQALGQWATGILLIGDAGRNSETAILYEDFARLYHGPLIVTRDALDLYKNAFDVLAERPDTLLVASFAQLQTIFKNLYYPKILTFSMQLQQLVEAVHKFTVTYPVTIATFHQGQLVVAHGGDVTTTPWENPMAIWRGSVATQAAGYVLWSPGKPLQAVTASLVV
jgi:ADP-dependent NAD(P)H-hydrate dehydratase / NAD(P)H-hydrate epimerase